MLMLDYHITEVAQIIKEDLNKKENCTSYGEPQAFFELDNGRSIEVVIEQEGLSPNEYYYSASLHCTEAEFDNGDFKSTNGVVDRYVSSDLSIEELWEVVGAALVSDHETPIAEHSKAQDFPEWEIPVTWEMMALIKVKAASLEEALAIAKDDDGVIPLPNDGDYVDGSWRVTDTDLDLVRSLYNDNQKDLVCSANTPPLAEQIANAERSAGKALPQTPENEKVR